MLDVKPLYHPVLIGSVTVPGNLFLAPIAGYSDRAFRSVCYEQGCDFGFTEMVSAEALVRSSGKTEKLTQRAANESLYGIQLFGGTPEIIAEAIRIVLKKESPALIDINAGCPVAKIIKTGAGSQLTRNPEQLYKIVRAAVAVIADTCSIPITVKIRSGWDTDHLTWKEAALAAFEAGAAGIAFHPRTKVQAYEGSADWEMLAQLVNILERRIPVFGSGDLFSPESAQHMLLATHCDAVMFARGALGNPFIFRQTQELLKYGHYNSIKESEKFRTGMYELELLSKDNGEVSACREMRKRFCAYSKGLPGGAELRNAIIHAESIDDYRHLFNIYFE